MRRLTSLLAIATIATCCAGNQALAQEPTANNGQRKTRIALVSNGTVDAANNLVDLAQVKLGAVPDIELLERKAVGRILQEQKLSLSGLVDANTAVQAGKLLSADLFALVEMDSAGKEALGLVVYDAASGLKLHDAVVPAGKLDAQVGETTAGVRQALKRHARGVNGLRTVALLGARNADLPRAMDSLGHTIAFLLERGLTNAPDFGVLERKRLEWVAKEKALTAAKDLLAAVTVVEVEIGRSSKGVRVAAYLSDNSGKQLGKVQVEGAADSASALTDSLLTSLLAHWKTSAPAAAPLPRRESQRFQRDGQRLASQKEWGLAVQALEAASALDSNDKIQADLARYLGEQGLRLLQPGPKIVLGGTTRLQVPSQTFESALDLGLRLLAVRQGALDKLPRKDRKTLETHATLYKGIPSDFFARSFNLIDPKFENDTTRARNRQFHEQYCRVIDRELDAWAELVRQELARDKASKTKPASIFENYFRALQRANNELRLAKPNKSEFELHLAPHLKKWLENSLLPDANCPNNHWSTFCRNYVVERPEHADVCEMMAKHPHALVQLYGRFHRLRLGLNNRTVTAGEGQVLYQAIRQAAFKHLEEYRPVAKVDFQEDLRTHLYGFLYDALNRWDYPDPNQKFEERFALCDFMLKRNELVELIFSNTVGHSDGKNSPCYSERWQLIERGLNLLDTGKHQLSRGSQFFRVSLLETRKRILAARPEFSKKLTTAVPPWKKAIPLVTLGSTIGQLGTPIVVGDQAFVADWGLEGGKYGIRLSSISLDDNKSRVLGAAVVRAAPAKEPLYASNHIVGCCLNAEQMFVGTRQDGIFVLDLKGGPGRPLAKDLPSGGVEALAYLDGKVYAALAGGYLVAVTASTGQVEVLASSRRRDRLTPFDDADVFRVPYLLADIKQRRVLFLLYQKPNTRIFYSSATIPSAQTTNGLWEYDAGTKSFKRHLEVYLDSLTWGSPVSAGRILMAQHGIRGTGAVEFDLATNKSTVLWAVLPLGPTLPKEAARSNEDYYPLTSIQLVRNEWLWSADPLSRASLGKRQQEHFATPGPPPASGAYFGYSLTPVGTDRLLLGDAGGLWLLKLTTRR